MNVPEVVSRHGLLGKGFRVTPPLEKRRHLGAVFMLLLGYKRKGFIMASVATNINISHMNGKQLQKLAFDVGVNPVIIVANATDRGRPEKLAALRTAIKAK